MPGKSLIFQAHAHRDNSAIERFLGIEFRMGDGDSRGHAGYPGGQKHFVVVGESLLADGDARCPGSPHGLSADTGANQVVKIIHPADDQMALSQIPGGHIAPAIVGAQQGFTTPGGREHEMPEIDIAAE